MADTPIEVPVGSMTLTGQGVNLILPVLVTEELNFTETVAGLGTFAHTRADTVRASDHPQPGWKFLIDESFNLSETFVIDWIVSIVDELFLSEDAIPHGSYGTILTELLECLDFPFARKRFEDILAESFDLSGTLVDIHKKVTVITEFLQLRETILNTGTFQELLAEQLNLVDALERILPESLADTLNLSEALTGQGIFLSLLSEAFNVSDIVAEIFTASVTVADTFQGTDASGNNVTFFVLSNDQLIVKSEMVVSGQVFACWVLTTKQYNPSVYSNYDFNSYARIQKKLYGARDDGIYLLEGATDGGDSINDGLLFDFANMDIPSTKRLRSIHLGSRTKDATVQVATERGDNKTYKTTQQRAVIGKEVVGKFWTVAVENVEDLKSMELNVILISKSR